MPLVTFESFSGERGALSSWRDQRLFSGSDVMIQVDGALTARPGFTVPFTWTWEEEMADQQVWAVGVGAGSRTDVFPATEHLWFLLGADLYAWDGEDVVTPERVGSTLENVPTQRCISVRQGSSTWIVSPEEGVYRYLVSSTGVTVTKMTNVVPGPAFAVWQGVEVCSGSVDSGSATPGSHRIYWSDLPGEWPATPNFTAVGDEGSAIVGLFVLRNQLFVAKDDGSWWVVTGTLSTTYDPEARFYVRDVARTQYPLAAQYAGHVNESFITFSPATGGLPVIFNGSQFTEVRHLVDSALTGADVLGGSGLGDVLMHKDGTAYFYQSGSWVKLTVPDAHAALYRRPQTNAQVFAWVTDPVTDTEVSPKVYMMASDPMPGPSSTLATESVTVPSTVTLAEVVGEGLIKPQYVHIDYTRIATTDPSVSGFDVTVRPTRYPAADGLTADPSPETVDRTRVETRIAGRYRETINLGALPASWAWEVTIAPLAGVAIHRVGVDYTDEGQARV